MEPIAVPGILRCSDLDRNVFSISGIKSPKPKSLVLLQDMRVKKASEVVNV